MAYREVACGSIAEVPALIAAFAAELGWQTSNPGGAEPTRQIRRPIEPDPGSGQPDSDIRTATSVRLAGRVDNSGPAGNAASSLGTTNLHEVRLTTSDDNYAALRARTPSPWFSNGDQRQPFIPLPTKLHLFGAGLPAPFIHCVIEYSFNLYRHVYVGSLDRTGKQPVCDVVATVQGINRRLSNGFNYSYTAWAGLFSGWTWTRGSQDFPKANGGLILPGGFRPFQIFSGSGSPRLSDSAGNPHDNTVWGGAKEGFADTLISHGFSPFSGENILSPINLFTQAGAYGTERRAVPLGAVRGVRNVNMRNLEPGQSIIVGNKRWRVFPQLAKSEDSVTRAGERQPSEPTASTYSSYSAGDTSHFWGLALLEGDA